MSFSAVKQMVAAFFHRTVLVTACLFASTSLRCLGPQELKEQELGAVAQTPTDPGTGWSVRRLPLEPVPGYFSIGQPTAVLSQGTWHLFCTVRGEHGSFALEHISFPSFSSVGNVERHFIDVGEDFRGSPQIFFFEPAARWILLFQVRDPAFPSRLLPAYSTNRRIDRPGSWSSTQILLRTRAKNAEEWRDYWLICDETDAYLFFTDRKGRLWKSVTQLNAFPSGWSKAQIALKGNILRANHTYRLQGGNFLTVVESTYEWRRYQKAYLATRLDGDWRPVAVTRPRPFLSMVNSLLQAPRWTDCFSHGELLRSQANQQMPVDSAQLAFLFQGVTYRNRDGRLPSQIPWRLGLAERTGVLPLWAK